MEVLGFLLDHGVAIAGLVSGLAVYFYHLARGDKQASLRDTLKAFAQGVVHDFVGDLDDPAVEAKVRIAITDKAKAWLAERKITGATADLLISAAVEIGVTELKRMLSQREQIKQGLSDLAAAASKVEDALKPPANPTVPKLDLNIEIAKPDDATADGS